MCLKSLGPSGLWKAKRHLHRSVLLKSIKLYIGVSGDYDGAILCRGLCKFIKVYNADTKISGDTTSTVLLMKIWPGMMDHPDYNFGYKMLNTVGRCSNYMGCRSISWCNHILSTLLFYYNMLNDIPTELPTPIISKNYRNVLNVSTWVHKLNQLDPDEAMDYLSNIFNESQFNNDIYGNTIENIRN